MKFRKGCLVAVGAMLLATTGFVSEGHARGPEIGIGIGIGIPVPVMPTIVVSGPPELVVVPGTNVYVAPDVEGDILFYQGFWWRLYDGRWYRSPYYDRGWVYMDRGRVPRSFYGYHPGFRHEYRGYQRVHYNDVHRNWNNRHQEGHPGGSRHEQGYSGGNRHPQGPSDGGRHQQVQPGGGQHQQIQSGGSRPQGHSGGGQPQGHSGGGAKTHGQGDGEDHRR